MAGWRSHRDFSQIYMPEIFYDKFTLQHEEALDLLDDETIPNLALECWRGWGKSSFMLMKTVRNICYRMSRHILWIGISFERAKEWTENVKFMLKENDRIIRDFGSVLFDWREEKISRSNTKSGYYLQDPKSRQAFCYIAPAGSDQGYRGKNVYIQNTLARLDLILCDDQEDEERIANDQYRLKVRSKLFGTTANLVSRKRPNPATNRWDKTADPNWTPPYRILYADTPKHEDSCINYVLTAPAWVARRFSQSAYRTDGQKPEDYYSLVPELISDQQVQAEVAQAIHAGTLRTYAMEKMCVCRSPGESCWKRDLYRYTPQTVSHGLQFRTDVKRYVIFDPARTGTSTSDFSAMTALAFSPRESCVYLRKTRQGRWDMATLFNEFFSFLVDMNTNVAGVEFAGNETLEYQLLNEARTRGVQVRIVKLSPRGEGVGDLSGEQKAKEIRGNQILLLYQQGRVNHDESLKNSVLEMQQLGFPSLAFWDTFDTVSYVPQLMQREGIMFAQGTQKIEPLYKRNLQVDRERFGPGTLAYAIRNDEWQVVNY